MLDQLLKDNLTEKQFTDELISLILHEAFEYGIDTKADLFIRKHMIHNEHVTKHWLFKVYKAYIQDIHIFLGLLRLIARIDYRQISSLGKLIVMQALSHNDIEVQESGVRALESWGTLECLEMLELHPIFSSSWLQKYADNVILDLRKEHVR